MPDYKQALLEILNSDNYVSMWGDYSEVTLDGTFSGPALTSALKALADEGLLGPDFWKRSEEEAHAPS